MGVIYIHIQTRQTRSSTLAPRLSYTNLNRVSGLFRYGGEDGIAEHVLVVAAAVTVDICRHLAGLVIQRW